MRTAAAVRKPRWASSAAVVSGAACLTILFASGPGDGRLAPAPAEASCGGVQTAPANKKRVRGRPPLAVGDSSMLLAVPRLAELGYKPNARGCRQMPEGLKLIRTTRRAGKLPHMVLIALGADGSVEKRHVKRALRMIGPRRRLVLVTPIELGGYEGRDAAVVRWAGKRFKRVKVLDWVRYSRGHGSWFQPDGLHLTFKGASKFAGFLARELPPRRKPGGRG